MAVIKEDDIQITLPDYALFKRFDDTNHGLSHCMKAVDYIIEMPERIIFLEIKDPDNPKAKPEKRQAFFEELTSEKIDNDLKIKYRDSFLYEWAFGRTIKPIHFWFLIGAERLDSDQLVRRTESLKAKLPILGPEGKPWKNPFVAGCMVLNLAAWNKYHVDFPAIRLST